MATRDEARRELARRELERRRASPQPEQQPAYSGSILPLSRDAEGNVSFDSDAGIVGAIKRAITLPGDLMTGKTALRDSEGNISDEVIGRSFEMGAVASPVNPAVRSGDRAIPGVGMAMRPEKVKPPTAQALHAAADEGYDSARNMGVDYKSDAVANVARALQADLEKDGILAELAPKSFAVLNKLTSPPEGSVAPFAGVEAARRAFRHAARDFNNPTDQEAARRIIDGLDEFVVGADPKSVVAGPASDVGRTIGEARGNYAAAKRSDKLTGIEEAAELRAAAANSGQNLDNSVRARIVSLLQKPKEAAGFTAAEKKQLEKVARGTVGRNATRAVGNLLGGGGGLGSVAAGAAGGTAGGFAGGPIGAVVGAMIPAVGFGAKRASNALTSRALRQSDEATRMRSPLYEQLQRDAPMTAIDPAKQAAVVRALLLGLEGRPD